MSDSPTRAATEAPCSQWLQAPQRPTTDVLQRAITSCDTFTNAAEQALLTGSVAAVRLAFTRAEAAFEEAQRCMVEEAAKEVPLDAEQASLSSLGLRLDALWMCLVCWRKMSAHEGELWLEGSQRTVHTGAVK
jgi:hypothetical protein